VLASTKHVCRFPLQLRYHSVRAAPACFYRTARSKLAIQVPNSKSEDSGKAPFQEILLDLSFASFLFLFSLPAPSNILQFVLETQRFFFSKIK
jgi:hypothetical protein